MRGPDLPGRRALLTKTQGGSRSAPCRGLTSPPAGLRTGRGAACAYAPSTGDPAADACTRRRHLHV